MRSFLYALAVVAVGVVEPALADELRPVQARSIDLAGVRGVAYYTVEENGYRIVATLADGESGHPIRFAAMLEPGQGISLSVPEQDGRPGGTLEIVRRGDRVLVLGPQLALN